MPDGSRHGRPLERPTDRPPRGAARPARLRPRGRPGAPGRPCLAGQPPQGGAAGPEDKRRAAHRRGVSVGAGTGRLVAAPPRPGPEPPAVRAGRVAARQRPRHPDPTPVTTIAWRLGHLHLDVAGSWEWTFGGRRRPPAELVEQHPEAVGPWVVPVVFHVGSRRARTPPAPRDTNRARPSNHPPPGTATLQGVAPRASLASGRAAAAGSSCSLLRSALSTLAGSGRFRYG